MLKIEKSLRNPDKLINAIFIYLSTWHTCNDTSSDDAQFPLPMATSENVHIHVKRISDFFRILNILNVRFLKVK